MGLSPDDITRLRELVADATATKFSIEREIGVGGMGRVFVGVERASGRRIAIKVLDPGLHGDAVRFAAEAELLEQLEHPAIVSYVAHGVTSDGRAYLAMTWLEGEPLSDRLKRGRLAPLEAVQIGARVAGALAYLHERGIVHRDIKPSNVFLVGNQPEAAVVIDLGIAKQLDAAQKLTRTGQLIGTPGYMAPEQVMGESTIDGRVDVFALGCLLHESIAGEMPFPGDAVMEVLARLLLHDPKPLDEIDKRVPPRLVALVSMLLAKEARDRTVGAAAAETELVAIAVALQAGDTAALATSPLPPQRPSGHAATIRETPRARISGDAVTMPQAAKPARRSRMIPLLAAGVVVAGAGVWIGTRDRGSSTPSPAAPRDAAIAAGPVVLPIEAVVSTKPAAPGTGHIVALPTPGLVGVDMVVATWCETGQRVVAVGADGRIYTFDRSTAAPERKAMTAPAIRDPASAVAACTAAGRALIVAGGRLLALEPSATVVRDTFAATLPANVIDGVAVGDTARFVAAGGVWEWNGVDPPARRFDTCGDPRRLAPDGERVACRRNGTIVVADARGAIEQGPRGHAARWTRDGKTLLVDQGNAHLTWQLGTPPDRAQVQGIAGRHATEVGPWIVTATGATLERRALTGNQRGSTKLPCSALEILAVVSSAREVVTNCGGRVRFVAVEQAELAALPRPARVLAIAFEPAAAGRIASADESGEVAVHGAGGARVAFAERAEYVPTGAHLVWRSDGILVLGGSLMLDTWAADGTHRKVFEGTADEGGITSTTGPIAGTDDMVRASEAGIEVASLDGGVARWLTQARMPDIRAVEVDRSAKYALFDGSRSARIVRLPDLAPVVELAELQNKRAIVKLALVAGDPLVLVVADSHDNVFAVTAGSARPLAKAKLAALAAPPVGRRVAIAIARDVIVLDVDTGAELFRSALDTPVSALVWDRAGKRLAASGYATELRYFDVE